MGNFGFYEDLQMSAFQVYIKKKFFLLWLCDAESKSIESLIPTIY
jgi:hypothetical protein